jgi:hypothetical protein
MANLQKITQSIADAINGLAGGVRAWGYPPDQIQPPSVVIEADRVEWANTAMGRGHENWTLLARVLIAPINNRAAQLERMSYFGGVNDIKDVVDSWPPLNDGTVAESVLVREARKFDAWEYSGVLYVGVEILIEVMA